MPFFYKTTSKEELIRKRIDGKILKHGMKDNTGFEEVVALNGGFKDEAVVTEVWEEEIDEGNGDSSIFDTVPNSIVEVMLQGSNGPDAYSIQTNVHKTLDPGPIVRDFLTREKSHEKVVEKVDLKSTATGSECFFKHVNNNLKKELEQEIDREQQFCSQQEIDCEHQKENSLQEKSDLISMVKSKSEEWIDLEVYVNKSAAHIPFKQKYSNNLKPLYGAVSILCRSILTP